MAPVSRSIRERGYVLLPMGTSTPPPTRVAEGFAFRNAVYEWHKKLVENGVARRGRPLPTRPAMTGWVVTVTAAQPALVDPDFTLSSSCGSRVTRRSSSPTASREVSRPGVIKLESSAPTV